MGRGARSQTISTPARSRAAATAARPYAIQIGEHQVVDLRLGVIDDAAVAAFTSGQCHAMALALHERTGWQIMRLYDDDDDVVHFSVRTPDGRRLDITGCHNEDDWFDGWNVDEEPVSAGDAESDWAEGGLREPDLHAARAYVDAVLAYVDGRPAYCPAGWENGVEIEPRSADVMHVAVGGGERVTIRPGELDDDARQMLRDRQDHALTRVLGYYRGDDSDLLNGAHMTVLWDAEHGAVRHCFTTLADGRALDIDGVHSVEQITSRYGTGELRRVRFRDMDALCQGNRPVPDDEAASTFVPAVLDLLRSAR